MDGSDPLEEYHRKRDFDATPEPRGDVSGVVETTTDQFPSFVVQKHAATRLHYDFRLEVDGVLKSWSVPKGPSLDPADKRLAVMTEDHPIDYADFEGVIPSGYGAGSVIVWDRGLFLNFSKDRRERDISIQQALEEGHVKVWLAGEKLRGGFALTRTSSGGDARNWVLVKKRDKEAQPGVDLTETRPASVLSGRTLEEVAAAPDAVWESHRP